MSFRLLHPRDQIVATMARIYSRDMTTTSGGNISIRDENGDVWITPARIDKGNLRREHIVRVSPDGSSHGDHPPSSEFPFHLAIYAERSDIRAVIHAHPGALVSFSICGQVPETRLFPESHLLCGAVAVADYALPGSQRLGGKVASAFASPSRPTCVVLENHGVVVGGADLEETFRRFETLEFVATTMIAARPLGALRILDDAELELAERADRPIEEHEPLPPTSEGKEARKLVCDFVRRAYSHRLMTSAWGSFSARTSDNVFVITPHGVDRHSLEIDDLVVVRDGTRAAGQSPSHAVRLHDAIYRAHPEVQAIVNALPVHATTFGISPAELDTRTIPESYLFLKDVPKIPYADAYGDGAAIARRVTPGNPVALLENNGAIVAGRSVLDAFDRLEVLEATAAAILRAGALGSIRKMPDEVTRELLAAFPGV